MGKNRYTKSIGNMIGNVVVHKILKKYTNKPESINHLNYEIVEYRNTAISMADEFNWNESDKEKIKSVALKHFRRKMARKDKDVKFPMKEAKKLLNQMMKESHI